MNTCPVVAHNKLLEKAKRPDYLDLSKQPRPRLGLHRAVYLLHTLVNLAHASISIQMFAYFELPEQLPGFLKCPSAAECSSIGHIPVSPPRHNHEQSSQENFGRASSSLSGPTRCDIRRSHPVRCSSDSNTHLDIGCFSMCFSLRPFLGPVP